MDDNLLRRAYKLRHQAETFNHPLVKGEVRNILRESASLVAGLTETVDNLHRRLERYEQTEKQ